MLPKSLFLLLTVASLMVLSAAPITLSGNATGTFYQGSTSLSSTVLHLSYIANAFGSQLSDLPLDLGEFDLNVCTPSGFGGCRDDYAPYTFHLSLQLTLSDGTLITATAVGDVSGAAATTLFMPINPTVWIDFDNTPVTYDYTNAQGTGSFDLAIQDIAKASPPGQFLGIPYSKNVQLTGIVSNETFVATVIPVPEAGATTLALLGLAFVGIRPLLQTAKEKPL
jgi:hypothetical protein